MTIDDIVETFNIYVTNVDYDGWSSKSTFTEWKSDMSDNYSIADMETAVNGFDPVHYDETTEGPVGSDDSDGATGPVGATDPAGSADSDGPVGGTFQKRIKRRMYDQHTTIYNKSFVLE